MDKLIVIVAESGAGKSTLQKQYIRRHPDVSRVITFTSRGAREGEKSGIDYWFVSEPVFRQKIEEGFFVEWDCYQQHLYGTPLKACRESNKIITLTPPGLRALKAKGVPVFGVYVRLSRRQRLIRILLRGDDVEEAIERSLPAPQFEGIEGEVDCILEADGKTPEELALLLEEAIRTAEEDA